MTPPDRDRTVWWLDRRVDLILPGVDTGGLAAFTRGTAPVPGSPAPYIRLREEALYFVARGCVRLVTARDALDLGVRDFCAIPPGVSHKLEDCGREPALFYAIYLPAGFDEFQLESGRPMRDPDAPVLPLTPVQVEQARRLARPRGVELSTAPEVADAAPRVARASTASSEARFLAEADAPLRYTLLELQVSSSGSPAMPPAAAAVCCVIEGRVRLMWDGSEVYLAEGGAACVAGAGYSIGTASQQPARVLLLTTAGAA
ncbi:MAG: hypothetical protein IPM24_26890 [Bryobacterales bacterium]|jgi:mannose-6-phosphate isomerase-like protein (cupin superfamily)|nr:hypothetical protein [Bryobacterales bacterium]